MKVEVDMKHLVSLVIRELKSLKGNDRLDITNIKNGENLAIAAAKPRIDMNDMRWHGGGDTVSAGSNVTITTVDGIKVISTLGGSFTVLTATEVPDGNITVFTFPAATAQPTFIISDNAQMRPTTSSGVVNWTWDNILKQALMTVSPNEDIVAII